jgi:hypothetical protein
MPTGYTPPAGNAVNFNFAGPPYSAPAGNAVILNFFNANAYVLTADPGSYAITGTAASIKASRRLFAYEQLIPGLAAGGFTFLDLSGWTVSGLTFTLVNGTADLVDASGGSGVAYRAIAVNPGQQYTLQGYLIDTTAPMGMAVGTTAGGQQLGAVLSFANGIVFTSNPATNPAKSITFTAPLSGVVYVSMFLGTSGHGHAGYLRMEQAGRYQLSGTDVTITKTGRILQAVPGTYAMTGSPVSLRVGRRITADPGSYTQTRTDVRLLIGRRLVADPGSYVMSVSSADITYIIGFFLHAEKGAYALQGSDVRLIYGRRLVAAPGLYSITGTDVSWVYRRMIKAAPGAYALTGADVQLRVGYRLAAQPGAYVLTGSDVGLINRRLIADPGTYALAGSAAGLRAGRKRLQATPGVYTVTGTSALLLAGRRLIATPGSYSLLGSDVALKVGRLLTVAPGVYSLTGTAARLLRGYTVHAVPGSYVLTWAAARVVTTRRMIAEAGVYRTSWPDVALVPTWRPRGPRAIAVGFAASRYVSVSLRTAASPSSRRIAAAASSPHPGAMQLWSRVIRNRWGDQCSNGLKRTRMRSLTTSSTGLIRMSRASWSARRC